MAKLQELQGWRRASGEELNYIRGALEARIKRDRNAGRLAAVGNSKSCFGGAG